MRIIAEIGSNWATFEHAKDSISLAKNCGAWAVKFQLYDGKALYGAEGPMANEMPVEWIPRLAEKAKACGIEFMCTAFSPEFAEAVNPYVNYHKVASSDLTHLRLLEKLNSFKKPVFLSTGASGEADIAMALRQLKDCPVTLMYCVAEYPARVINFKYLEALKKYGRPVGYSDHSLDAVVVPMEAMRRGAEVIEKHVNLVGVTNTPDAPHSLSLDEFKAMCQAIEGKTDFHSSERDMRLRHNRRLIAIKPIAKGDKLIEGENFGAYRSLTQDTEGLSPWLIPEIDGKRLAKEDRQMGQPIRPQTI